MKKIKKCMIAIVVFATVIINSTGCESKPIMDEDKCAEVALEYMKNKYQKDFELVSSVQNKKVIGRKGYATVRVLTDEEKEYCVMVYPDGDEDTDKDGYYDSYKVGVDDYICTLVEDNIKYDLDEVIKKIGIKQFISGVYVRELTGYENAIGFSSDFYLNEENNTLVGLLKSNDIKISYNIEIPQCEFSTNLEDEITGELKKYISEDIIYVNIDSYDENTYSLRKKIYEEFGYDKLGVLVGIDNISFFIEEEKNESK